MFLFVAPGLILDAPGCHKKSAVTWQVYLFAAVGFPPKKQHSSRLCGFPCILQGLILDAPGCKEAKVSSATVWLWFLYAVLSWCQEPGCAQVILGATCQEKWSQKSGPKRPCLKSGLGLHRQTKNGQVFCGIVGNSDQST